MKEKTKQKTPAVTVRPALDIADQLDYEIVSDHKVKFTRARAFEFLELETFQGERQVNERHVQFLYNQWSSGRFMWDHVLIGICRYQDKFYRINGQHTCWLRVNIEEDFFSKLGHVPLVREITYQVKQEDGLRGLYATFDQNKTRTQNHMVQALVLGTVATSDIWPSIISKLSQGLRMLLYPEPHERVLCGATEMAAYIEGKHAQLFKLVGLFVQQHYTECGWIRRSPVVAAMFSTFAANPEKSQEFWSPVFSGLGLEIKGDPRYQLRKFMETHRQSIKSEMMPVSAEDSYRICILAWNKWRNGDICQSGLRSTDKRQKASK